MRGIVRWTWGGVVAVAVISGMGTGTSRADMLYAVNASTQTLEAINTSTLTVTKVGSLGMTDHYGGLAYNTLNQTLYLLDGRSQMGLYTVNMATGAASLVGLHGVTDLFGLGFDTRTGLLYGSQFATGNQLYSLSASTGSATLIGSTGLPMGLGGLAYNPTTNTMVGIANGQGTMYAVNETTAFAAYLASPGQNNDSGLAYDTTHNLYWDIDYDGNLYSIDPANSYTRTLRLTGLAPQDGLAFVSTTPAISPIPTPSSGALLGVGLVGLVTVARSRRSPNAQAD